MRYFQRANDVYNTKNYKEAISLYKEAIYMKDNEPSSLYNCAVCFMHLKEYKKAIPLLISAIDINRESKYYFNLGYCYSMGNDKQKALKSFLRAYALNSDDKDCEKAIELLLKTYKVSG
jgi:tetratricopeptide (TPR) repeat protein